MLRLRPMLIAAAAALVLAGPLSADPLNPRQVSAKAKWLVHADVKAFLASKSGEFALDELKKRGLGDVLNNIQEAFGLDVTKDLKSVTVYGSSFAKAPAIILIHAALDRDRITQAIQGNETYKELTYGGHKVHQWKDNPQSPNPGPTKFGAFHGADLAVMAEDINAIQQALDVLDGKAASLASGAAAKALPSAVKAPFLTAMVAELPPIGKGKPEGVVLRKISSVNLAVGESEGRLHVHVELTAKKAKTATNLRKIGDGLLALLDLVTPDDDEGAAAGGGDAAIFDGKIPAELIAVLKNVTVAAKDRTVTLDANVATETVIALVRKIMAKKAGGAGPSAP